MGGLYDHIVQDVIQTFRHTQSVPNQLYKRDFYVTCEGEVLFHKHCALTQDSQYLEVKEGGLVKIKDLPPIITVARLSLSSFFVIAMITLDRRLIILSRDNDAAIFNGPRIKTISAAFPHVYVIDELDNLRGTNSKNRVIGDILVENVKFIDYSTLFDRNPVIVTHDNKIITVSHYRLITDCSNLQTVEVEGEITALSKNAILVGRKVYRLVEGNVLQLLLELDHNPVHFRYDQNIWTIDNAGTLRETSAIYNTIDVKEGKYNRFVPSHDTCYVEDSSYTIKIIPDLRCILLPSALMDVSQLNPPTKSARNREN